VLHYSKYIPCKSTVIGYNTVKNTLLCSLFSVKKQIANGLVEFYSVCVCRVAVCVSCFLVRCHRMRLQQGWFSFVMIVLLVFFYTSTPHSMVRVIMFLSHPSVRECVHLCVPDIVSAIS